MVVSIGIDPGISGAIAVMSEDGVLLLEDMPAADGAVTGSALAHMLQPYAVHGTRACIEFVRSMPKDGVASAFKFGRASGAAEGVVAALNVPIMFVAAGKWKRAYGLIGKDKDAGRRKALELYPDQHAKLARKKDHNRADALLLARYGMGE